MANKQNKSKAKNRCHQYRKLINTRRWQKLRLSYLGQHPLCEDCLLKDRVEPATQVHHIDPIENYIGRPDIMEKKAFSLVNLRALCEPCHIEAHRVLKSKSKEMNKQRKEQEVQAFCKRFFEDYI